MAEPTADARLAELALGGASLRTHTARGTLVNAAFMVGLTAVGALRQLSLAIFLTAADFGVWGLIYAAFATVLWFKEVGISDKFIQQDEADQEAAFQRAFTLNLLWTLAFVVLVGVAMPFAGVVYGHDEIILPGIVLAVAVLGTTLHAPVWVAYRQMRFVRQRVLQSIEPVVGLVVTVALAAAGLSYWSIVLGVLAGTWSSGLAAVITSPHPIRLRYDGATLREYVSFSWPVLVATGSTVVVVQLAVILGEATAGLAGVGAIGLAGTIAAFSDRVNQIVTATLYPAICAMRDRSDLLLEAFTKSNRIALAWAVPFGIALTLFATDLVEFVLADDWGAAEVLLQVFGITAVVNQIGFGWPAFQRAVGDTRPLAAYGLSALVVFVVVGVPAMIAWGVNGYAVAISAIVLTQLCMRAIYVRRLFEGFGMLRHSLAAIAPYLPAAAVILGLRQLESGDRTAALAIGELALFWLLALAATWFSQRSLLREIRGYLRGAPTPAQAA